MMRPIRKNNFYSFIFAFIPGAAEMYMGFMRKGISLMAIFMLIFINCMTYVPIFQGLFLSISIIVWFFGFFHALHIRSCSDEDFHNIKDDFIWNEFISGKSVNISSYIARKWAAIILIVLGILGLWQNIQRLFYSWIPDNLWDKLYPLINSVPQLVFSVFIIFIGFALIRGKKHKIMEETGLIESVEFKTAENSDYKQSVIESTCKEAEVDKTNVDIEEADKYGEED